MSHFVSRSRQRYRRFQQNRRHGVAAVEFAVCLPVIALLVFCSIEASSYIFLAQSLHVAAYEAVREASSIGGTNAEARTLAERILAARQVRDARIDLPDTDAVAIPRGELIRVSVTAPADRNSPLLGRFIPNRPITARVVMMKE